MVYLRSFRHIFTQTFVILSRNMSQFSVRFIDAEPSIQISFEYGHNGGHRRTFNADRQKTEELGTTLSRLAQNINKHINKKAKKRKRPDENDEQEGVTMKLFESDGSTEIPNSLPLGQSLKHGQVVLIETEKYVIDLNPPCCSKITIPQTAMVGFPIFPKLEVEFCNISESEYKWEKVKYEESDSSAKGQKPQPPKAVESHVVGTSLMYTPSNEDIGYRLALTCVPRNGDRQGKPINVESKYEVTAGPGLCPFENRHLYTQKETEKGE